MQVLNFYNNEDYNSFKVEGVRGNVVLMSGYNKQDDGILWGMQRGIMVKSHYTVKDRVLNEIMKLHEPIQNGDVVMIEGNQYKTRILGNYSDCVIFDPIEGGNENE